MSGQDAGTVGLTPEQIANMEEREAIRDRVAERLDAEEQAAPARELMLPGTGELIDLAGMTTTDICDVEARVRELTAEAGRAITVIKAELARRLDARNKRKARVGDYELEANAPTSDEYLLDVLRGNLLELVEAGVLEADVVDEVIVTPPPKPQDPRVDKRELNKLKKHPDARVGRAIDAARTVKQNTRTVKISRKDQPA